MLISFVKWMHPYDMYCNSKLIKKGKKKKKNYIIPILERKANQRLSKIVFTIKDENFRNIKCNFLY